MMRWNTFPRALVFAAVSGLALVPTVLVAGRFVPTATALSAYLVIVIALYVGGIAQQWSQGIRMAALAALLGFGVAFVATSVTALAAGGAMVLAVCRSGFLYRTAPARALVIEVGLGAGSLAVAAYLAGPTLVTLGLALWAFLLVQSIYFLVGGVEARDPEADGRDPFDVARSRALEVLERI